MSWKGDSTKPTVCKDTKWVAASELISKETAIWKVLKFGKAAVNMENGTKLLYVVNVNTLLFFRLETTKNSWIVIEYF